MENAMRTVTICLLGLMAQALASGASAQESYVLGSAGRSDWAYDCGPSGCERNTGSWRVAAGYRFNRVVAVEGFYFDLGRARSSDYSVNGRLGATGFGVETLLGWQFGDVELAAKLGLASMRNDFRTEAANSAPSTSVHRTEFIAGVTGTYRVTPGIGVRLDADYVTVALDGDALFYSRGSNVTTVLLGLMVRF
jgi:hypothetical protein